MKPSSVVLGRKYRFPDTYTEKSEEWGERLWKLLRLHLTVDVPPALRDREQYDFITDRLVNFVLARLVTRGVQIYKATVGLPEGVRLERWGEAAADVLDVSDEVCDDIAWHLSKICPRIVLNGARLTPAQKRVVTRFAKTNSHRCYLCGLHLDYDGAEQVAQEDASDGGNGDVEKAPAIRRDFEIDHIFPQKRGGGRSPENIAACCEDCNKYKDVLLSYADFAIESAITTSVGDNVKTKFGGRNKFALLWRQSGSCAVCNGRFYDAQDERLYLIRRNEQDCYHFMNVEIACSECFANRSLEGVQLRE